MPGFSIDAVLRWSEDRVSLQRLR